MLCLSVLGPVLIMLSVVLVMLSVVLVMLSVVIVMSLFVSPAVECSAGLEYSDTMPLCAGSCIAHVECGTGHVECGNSYVSVCFSSC